MKSIFICLITVLTMFSNSVIKINAQSETIKLNLRIHIMETTPWIHSSGVSMNSWVTPKDVNEVIMPELNEIWSQANIVWSIESIIEENVVVFKGDSIAISYIVNSKRDSEGRSDKQRLPHLYSLMQPQYRSEKSKVDSNLYHIYLFPFIGNTSQGNAMKRFDCHAVVGIWSNKHNRGKSPEKTLLQEDHDLWKRGSLSRTIAHELGHVLRLTHNQCSICLMKGQGYMITPEQIEISRQEAIRRSK
jgi:hypothetical protein